MWGEWPFLSLLLTAPAPYSLLLGTTGNFVLRFSSIFLLLIKLFLVRGELLFWQQQILNAWFPCAWLHCNYQCRLPKVKRTYSFFRWWLNQWSQFLQFVSSVQLEAERVYSVVSEHRNDSCIHNTDTDTYPTTWSQLPSPFFPCHCWQGCAHTLLSPCLFPCTFPQMSQALILGSCSPRESILKKTRKIIREWSNNWMYTWTSTVPKDYHILVINKWKANTSKFSWQRLGWDRTSTDSEESVRNLLAAVKGQQRPEIYSKPALGCDSIYPRWGWCQMRL